MNLQSHALIYEVVSQLKALGSWTGKTHLQKALFMVKLALPEAVPFEYVLYKHGPYSFDVERDLEQMRLYDAVSVEPDDKYGVSLRPGGGEVQLKGYEVNGELHEEIARACRKLAKLTVQQLEALSTAAWVIQREGARHADEAVEGVQRLKPHLDETLVRWGVEEAAVYLGVDI